MDDSALSPDMVPASESLRVLLAVVLKSDSDLEAFCLDFFPEVQKRFSNGMERMQKVSLLLGHTDRQAIWGALSQSDIYKALVQSELAKDPNILKWEKINTVSPSASAANEQGDKPLELTVEEKKILTTIWQKLNRTDRAFSLLMLPGKEWMSNSDDFRKQYKHDIEDTIGLLNDFIMYFNDYRIYLHEGTCIQIDQYIRDRINVWNRFHTYPLEQGITDRFEVFLFTLGYIEREQARAYVQGHLAPLKEQIEQALRNQLGVAAAFPPPPPPPLLPSLPPGPTRSR